MPSEFDNGDNDVQPDFAKTVYVQFDDYDQSDTYLRENLDDAANYATIAVYELVAVGIARTKLTNRKAVSK